MLFNIIVVKFRDLYHFQLRLQLLDNLIIFMEHTTWSDGQTNRMQKQFSTFLKNAKNHNEGISFKCVF